MDTSWKSILIIVSFFGVFGLSSCSEEDDPQPRATTTKTVKEPSSTSTEGQDPIPDPKG